jgi:hypothetical protein
MPLKKGTFVPAKKKFPNSQPYDFKLFLPHPVQQGEHFGYSSKSIQTHPDCLQTVFRLYSGCIQAHDRRVLKSTMRIILPELELHNTVMEKCRQIFSRPFCREGEMSETLAC